MNSSQNAIAVLYRKYWQKLYIHAYNLLNDGESAKDVLSDVFCSVLENSEQFEGKTDLLPLFYVMVKNRCIDHIRHQNVVNRKDTWKNFIAVGLPKSIGTTKIK